jgi:glycosyltransferase involved in cell wall biosynthesis
MKSAIISVITPVYNGQEFIRETIESVLRYSEGHPVEYIVVNDGSTDGTLDILLEYQSLIRIISTENFGESSAVNEGINNATGEFILILSADDPLMTKEIFTGVVDYFSQNPESVVLYSDWQMIDTGGNILSTKHPGSYSEDELIGSFHCQPGPGTFFRRDAAILIGGRSTSWRFVGDYDFWLRMSRVGKFGYRNKVLAQWRSHDASTSISLRGSKMAMERIGVIENFTHNHQLSEKLRRQALSAAYVSASQLTYFSSEVPGKRYLLNAFLIARGWPRNASLRVVFFVCLTPFSRLAMRLIDRRRFS